MEETTLDWALRYIKLGWHVLPIHGIKDGRCDCNNPTCPEKNWGKHPRTANGLSDASIDVAQVTEWFSKWPDSNIGIHCVKSGICVLDKDPRNGGNDTLYQLTAVYGDLPNTVKANTGGDGTHDIFQYHKDFGLPQGFNGGGLDIRKNAYIVVAPSIHKSGKQYEWLTDQAPWEISLAPAPNFLSVPKLINAPIDQEGKAKEDLENLSGKPEVKGEVYSFTENQNGTLQILVNGDATGAWIDTKGYIGSHSHGGPTAIQWLVWYGHTVPEAFKIAEKYGLSISQSPINEEFCKSPISLSEFLKKDIPLVEFIVTDIIQKKGKGMISAAPNVGKSIFVQNMALDIATGVKSYMGKFPIAPAIVAYIDLEMGESALQERFKKMCSFRRESFTNIYVKYIPSMDLLNEESKKLIEGWLKELKVDVLILDPLGNAWSGDESKQELVGKLTTYLNTLIERFGIAILVVHHWRKANKDANTGGQMAAGSYKWSAWIDCHVTLEGNPSKVTVSCHKNRNRSRFSPFMAKLNIDTLCFEYISDYQIKYDGNTLQKLFESFGTERVAITELIKKAEEEEICSETTLRKLIRESEIFTTDKSGKTHYLFNKHQDELNCEEVIAS